MMRYVILCVVLAGCAMPLEEAPVAEPIVAEPVMVEPAVELRGPDLCEVGDDGIGGTGCPQVE